MEAFDFLNHAYLLSLQTNISGPAQLGVSTRRPDSRVVQFGARLSFNGRYAGPINLADRDPHSRKYCGPPAFPAEAARPILGSLPPGRVLLLRPACHASVVYGAAPGDPSGTIQ